VVCRALRGAVNVGRAALLEEAIGSVARAAIARIADVPNIMIHYQFIFVLMLLFVRLGVERWDSLPCLIDKARLQ